MYERDKSTRAFSPTRQSYLRAPFGALAQILGQPDRDPPEKSSTCWALRMQGQNDQRVLLKDRRTDDDSFQVAAFRGQPSYDWEVWADSKAIATEFCKWCSGRVIEVVNGIKTLDGDAKARMNELLAQGATLDEAMKQVKMTRAESAPTRFAWPIADKKG